jgi:peptidoglycan/LPS O-acetylase OafA/YrhL
VTSQFEVSTDQSGKVASDAHNPPGHLPALDGLRALAVFVVVQHNLSLLQGDQGFLAHQLGNMLHRGWVGVQLFFVLSGFLITRILLDARQAPRYYASFYSRRALRIFPLYYAVLIGLFLALPALWHMPAVLAEDGPASRQIWLWLYLSNWTGPRGFGGGAAPVFHFWSLAVEEQFYLLWPLVVRHCTPRRLVQVCAGVIVAAMLCRGVELVSGSDPQAIYTSTLSRMDALALGAMVAAWLRSPWRPTVDRAIITRLLWTAFAITVLGWIVTHGFPGFTVIEESIGFTLVALAFAALVGASVLAASVPQAQGRWYRFLAAPMLRPIAKYSYAIYVFHIPLHTLVGLPLLERWAGTRTPGVAATLAYMAILTLLSYAAAWLSYRLIERPFLRLRGPAATLPATRSATAS